MFKDLFIPKYLSVKLKEKGFDEPCFAVYRNESLYFNKMISGYLCDIDSTDFSKNSNFDKYFLVNKTDENYWITAPTYHQVLVWLFEKHRILVEFSTFNNVLNKKIEEALDNLKIN